MTALLIGKEPGVPLGFTYVREPPYDVVVIGSLTLGELLPLGFTRDDMT